MSSTSLFCFCLAALVTLTTCRGAEPPYTAFVVEETAVVRSGPGRQFYETSTLKWGSRVDVYRHDGDYAAIRPPEGSFSWVPADGVEIGSDQSTATVCQPNLKTRIGSEILNRFDAEYVTLKVDEVLDVLGFQTVDDGSRDVHEWVKVAPPAGEFRWVRLSDLQMTPPVRAVSLTSNSDEPALITQSDEPPSDSGTIDPSNDSVSELPPGEALGDEADLVPIPIDGAPVDQTGTEPDESEAEQLEREAMLAQWSYELSPRMPLHAAGDDFDREARQEPQHVMPTPAELVADRADYEEPSPAPADAPVGSPTGFSDITPRSSSITPEYLAHQLAQLEIVVSQEICKPTADWQLSSVHNQCLAIIDAAASAEIRQRAHALLAKIVQFEDLRRRELRLTDPTPSTMSTQPQIATAAPPPILPTSPQPLYDGSGWLMPVLTNRTDVPRYVLTDDEGQVLQFVTATPGLNLSRYERKKIGIFGQKGYLPSVSQPHLMAERIISLDRVR